MILLLATQCSTQPVAGIKGRVTMAEGWEPVLYLVQPRSFSEIAANYSGVVIDSVKIGADGRFVLSPVRHTDTRTLYQLCIQKSGSRFQNQLRDDNPLTANYMPLVLQAGETLDITSAADSFQAAFTIINPAADNRALLQLRDMRQQAYGKQTSLHQPGVEHVDESNLLEQEDALRQYQLPMMAFADSTTQMLPALVAARWVSPAGDYERIPEFIYGLCQKWGKKSGDHFLVAQLCEAANPERLPVLTGDILPNEALPMANGDTVMLHQLLGTRLTILDIWASWCMPCRRENREVLMPLRAQYPGEGLQIIGYSIDSSPGAWQAAIRKDGAAWPHASHLTGDATPFMDVLRVTTIPANFMLDANGKVLAKNLHGDALKQFVEHYLK